MAAYSEKIVRFRAHTVIYIVLLLIGQCLSDVSIKIMTYNIRVDSKWAKEHGGDLRFGRTWKLRRKRVSSTIKMSKAAIIGLQEALHGQVEDLRKGKLLFHIKSRCFKHLPKITYI